MLYQRKRKQRTVYTQLYVGSITTPKGCIQFQIPVATVARRRSCIWSCICLFSADVGNATVSTNSKQVGLRHSRCINMFYFSGLSFRDTQRVWVFGSEFSRHPRPGSEFFGSEFSRHPRVWGFWVWVFKTPEGLSFLGLGSEFPRSEFSRHPFTREDSIKS